MNLTSQDAKKIRDILESDSQMMRKLNIMDYSLLFGIEKYPKETPLTPSIQNRMTMQVVNGL